MKLNFLTLASAIALFFVFFTSCKKEKDPINSDGYVRFSIKLNNNLTHQLKSTTTYSLSEAKKIVLNIQNADGSKTDYSSKEVSVSSSYGMYYSEKIGLKAGSFKLTEFALLDVSGNTIFKTPVSGSFLDQNVTPLPISFNIEKDIVSQIIVEVLSTENTTNEYFELPDSSNSVGTFNFMIAITSFSEDTSLSANLRISNKVYSLESNIKANANNVVKVKDGLFEYLVNVKVTGYKVFSQKFTLAEIKAHEANNENLPLFIELEKFMIPDDGLIAYYPFNGNSIDETHKGNNGTVFGASLTSDRYGYKNKAYSFNGVNSYISISPSFISNNEQGTFSAWVKFRDVDQLQYICSGGNVNSQNDYLSLFRLDTTYKCISIYTHNRIENSYVLGSSVIHAGIYYHLVITSNGNKWNLYVNGTKETLTVKAGNNNGAWMGDLVMENFTLGGLRLEEPYDHAYFKGILDDIRIYDRELSEEEIAVLANE